MGIRILLADDSVTAQNMGKKILSEAGHEVVTVSNGAAAAKKIAEMKPDLALLDVFMPGYSGLELCEKLRKAADTTRLPVILTVGKMEPYSPQDGARVKADGVIVKPFEASDLTAAVERLAQKLTSTSKSSTRDHKQSKPPDYEPTVRLDAKQIAEMLKSGEPSTSNPATDPAELTPAMVSSQAEEFHVAPAQPEVSEAAMAAFGKELASAAKTENGPATMNSYMEEYLSEAPTVVVKDTTHSSSAEGDNPLAQPVSNDLPADLPVSTFELPNSVDAPVAALEGFEPTAAAAVSEMPVAQEPGFEATRQSSEALSNVDKDPALETDPHKSTTGFPTQFGTSEADIYEAPTSRVPQEVVAESDAMLEATLSAHHSGEPQQSVRPIDEFEARLQHAMSAYQSDSEAAVPNFGESAVETQPAASAVEPSAEATPTFPEEVAPGANSEAWNSYDELEAKSLAPIESHEFKPEAVAAISESHLADAVGSAEIAQVESEGVMEVAHAASPETDDTVIAQMRESLSDVPVDGASMPEVTESEAAPMAMAAAAATVPPFSAPSSVPAEHETAFEITRALTYAMGIEASSETGVESTTDQPTDHPNPGDSNKMATAVERVLQRELPSLVWKVMAEIDLEKQRR